VSEKTTSEEMNIVIGIKNSLEKNSKFMFYDGMDYKASQDVKETRSENIEFKVAQGTYFNIDDFFILKEVHNLGVTNVATMLKRLAVEKKRNPEKAYPFHDYHSLMARMRFLVRQGLMYSFEYSDSYKRSMFVFCCSMSGWRLYKNKLQSPDVYDKNVVFKAETEVFKRLASNAVAYAFATSPGCSSVVVNDTIAYGDNKRGYIYSRVSLGDSEKSVYVIDPVYFNVDHRIVSDAENEAQIQSRLSQMEEVFKFLNNQNPTKLIFCIENYEGLIKLLKIIKTKEIDFYCNNCYFTSENVLFESGDVLSRSFLKLSLKEGKYSFSLAKDTWF
jgi:hypothetical protein